VLGPINICLLNQYQPAAIDLASITGLIYVSVMLDIVWGTSDTAGIATGYGLDVRGVGVRVLVGSRMSRIFSSPRRPDRFWGPPSLLTNGYRGLFLRK
jgi:hypothetical protein